MKQESNLPPRCFKPLLYQLSYSSRPTVVADEERFELSIFGLTDRCSAIELFIHVGPERLERSTYGVKDRYSTN
jgi:hypothetical protein